MALNIGVCGLGIMGGAFANNLARNGFHVIGYDPSKVRSNIFKTHHRRMVGKVSGENSSCSDK